MSAVGNILLVDDEPAFIEFVRTILAGEGYLIASAGSGREALELYPQFHPDLIVLDVSMPEMNGFETCRQLVAAYGEECAPVIFFTALTSPNDITEGFHAGGSDYLAKPSTTLEIRARVRSHLQTHLLAKQQALLVEQLSRTNTAKNRFIGMAAHDMRNPLVSIRGFSEFLLDGTVGPMPTEQLALVSIIRDTSNAMIKTLNELLDVATIEAGELQLQLSSQNLVDLVTKSISHAKLEARRKRIRILFAPPEQGPSLVCDADKIKQVVGNLLGNAIKYSPPATVITVVVSDAGEAGTCGVAVIDQGPGIPPAERDKLFKNFGRLAVQTAPGENHLGLGLTICRNIVEAHRGTISAENLPDRGCEVRVTLPLTG